MYNYILYSRDTAINKHFILMFLNVSKLLYYRWTHHKPTETFATVSVLFLILFYFILLHCYNIQSSYIHSLTVHSARVLNKFCFCRRGAYLSSFGRDDRGEICHKPICLRRAYRERFRKPIGFEVRSKRLDKQAL